MIADMLACDIFNHAPQHLPSQAISLIFICLSLSGSAAKRWVRGILVTGSHGPITSNKLSNFPVCLEWINCTLHNQRFVMRGSVGSVELAGWGLFLEARCGRRHQVPSSGLTMALPTLSHWRRPAQVSFVKGGRSRGQKH